MNILQAIDDPRVFASAFKDRASWRAWFAFLAALFGLPMTPEQQPSTGNARNALTAQPQPQPRPGWSVVVGPASPSRSPSLLCSSPVSRIGGPS